MCLKLAIFALNWSTGMVDAGVNFFNLSASIGVYNRQIMVIPDSEVSGFHILGCLSVQT